MEIGNCKLVNHGMNPFSFLCIDPACQYNQKYACLGCLAFNQPNHKFVQYDDIYSQINKISSQQITIQEQQGETMLQFLEKKRDHLISDLKEVIYLLDMTAFKDIYQSNSNSSVQSSSSNEQNLLNQYNQIKGKPFHQMNNQEINLIISLYNSVQNIPQNSNSSQQQNSSFQSKKEQINQQYNKNKKSIITYINTYREQVEQGNDPKNYSDILNSQVNPADLKQREEKIASLTKDISRIQSELAPLKQRNSYLEEQNQNLTVKYQSAKEQLESLKSRQQQQQQSVQNLNLRVQELQTQLNITNSNYSNLQTKYKQIESDNEEYKEALIKAKLALDIYQIKYKQLTEALEQRQKESAIANLRAAIIEAQQDERRKQELLQRQRQQGGRVEVTECNVQ